MIKQNGLGEATQNDSLYLVAPKKIVVIPRGPVSDSIGKVSLGPRHEIEVT